MSNLPSSRRERTPLRPQPLALLPRELAGRPVRQEHHFRPFGYEWEPALGLRVFRVRADVVPEATRPGNSTNRRAAAESCSLRAPS